LNPLVKSMINGASKNLIDTKEKSLDHKNLDKKIDEVIENGGALSDENIESKSSEKPAINSAEKYNDKGYSKKEIEKMNHLIEIVN